MGEILVLPQEMQPMVESYIDKLNERVLARHAFWQKSTCRDAVNVVLRLSNEHLGLSFDLPVDPATMSRVEQELAFNLFQLAMLNFAYNAHKSPVAREFIGIPTSFPWASTVALLYPLAASASALYRQAVAGDFPVPESLVTAVGYGLTNLGYLLLGSGLVFGKFGALRLRNRRTTLGTGIVALLVGLLIVNVVLG